MNRYAFAVSSLALAVATGFIVAGPLDPPQGPVASTYRTLTEVEPRIPLSTGRTISEPGSYYLTRDITTANNSSAFTITASNVTLDLNGFTLQGGPNTAKAIVCVGTPDTLVVRNGIIRDWGQRGIEAPGAHSSRFENLSFIACGLDGIVCGENCIVTNCVASDNGQDGIQAGSRSVVSNCTSFGNTGYGFLLANMSAVTQCTATGNGASGFHVMGGSHVSACVAARNTTNGIFAAGSSVIGNTCTDNGVNGVGAGISIGGSDSRVEGNHVTGNDYGIQVGAAGNLIIRNSASGNPTGNFVIVGGNTVGPSVVAASITGNSNPHANYEF